MRLNGFGTDDYFMVMRTFTLLLPITVSSTVAGGRSENRAGGGPARGRIFLTSLFGYFCGMTKVTTMKAKSINNLGPKCSL